MLDFFLSYLLVWKYALLIGVVFFASVGFPLPATAVIMAAGAFASQGYFGLAEILVFSLLASVAGDTVGYVASRRYGRKLFEKAGMAKAMNSVKFKTLEELFKKRSSSIIFMSRFLATSLGPTVNALSGFSKIPFKKFFPIVLVGELLYVSIFTGLGFVFGDQWEAISSITKDVTNIVVLVIVFVTLSTLFVRYKKKKRRLFWKGAE